MNNNKKNKPPGFKYMHQSVLRVIEDHAVETIDHPICSQCAFLLNINTNGELCDDHYKEYNYVKKNNKKRNIQSPVPTKWILIHSLWDGKRYSDRDDPLHASSIFLVVEKEILWGWKCMREYIMNDAEIIKIDAPIDMIVSAISWYGYGIIRPLPGHLQFLTFLKKYPGSRLYSELVNNEYKYEETRGD
jgi:hypothetical protein